MKNKIAVLGCYAQNGYFFLLELIIIVRCGFYCYCADIGQFFRWLCIEAKIMSFFEGDLHGIIVGSVRAVIDVQW